MVYTLDLTGTIAGEGETTSQILPGRWSGIWLCGSDPTSPFSVRLASKLGSALQVKGSAPHLPRLEAGATNELMSVADILRMQRSGALGLAATILVVNKEMLTQTKKKRRPSRSVVAYHEAGHAIACHTLGSRVLAVSVIPDYAPWGIDGDGYCIAEFPSNVDGMAMLMAGEMAQLRFDPKSEGTYPFAGDEHKMEVLLTAMVNQAVAELNL